MRGKRRREITDDERKLWMKAVEKTDILQPQKLRDLIEPTSLKVRPKKIAFTQFKIGEKSQRPTSHSTFDPLARGLQPNSPNMDKRNHDRLKKGKLRVEGRLDLHGMSLAQAHPALTRFVSESHSDGKRLLLVITGKGRPDAGALTGRSSPRGVLRQQVPHWLKMPNLAPLVLQIEQASRKHGGDGAYYVYLKRRR